MIVKLKGFIEFCSEEYIDLDVNGIVFRVFISNKSIDKIYPSESLVSIFVYELIKTKTNLKLIHYSVEEVKNKILRDQLGFSMPINKNRR